ncbi:extensin-like [Macadamia integrifolia]|uniref:extensin-like n=1 Tax=Macadamia integrifolia TaxID=60698 RepID=UPI001C52FC87|nr:extensin-like [Macadamia integrifolia]
MKLGLHPMECRRNCKRLWILLLYVSIAATLFNNCDARRSRQLFKFEGATHPSSNIKGTKTLRLSNHLDVDPSLDSTNSLPYGVSSPFTLPPFDSLGPIPLPENTPPVCVFPPSTPLPPSTTTPTPVVYYAQPPPPPPSEFPPIFPNPSPSGTIPNPPEYAPTPNPPEYGPSPPGTVPSPPEIVPSPPEYIPNPPESAPSPPEYIPNPPESAPSPPEYIPSPPESAPSPPEYIPSPPESVPSPPEYEPSPPGFVPSPPEYEPSPPGIVPSPPEYVPSPGGIVPNPPVFLPPVVYPLPHVPPPPYTAPVKRLWCVAKPAVPDPIIQEAMNYACGSGADCSSIQPDGTCFKPDTLFAHASYAFNSFWQRTKLAGGTCDFGGVAILISVDPSYDGCHFLNF